MIDPTVAGADPGFFLGRGKPLRNGVTDWWRKQNNFKSEYEEGIWLGNNIMGTIENTVISNDTAGMTQRGGGLSWTSVLFYAL